MMNISKYILGVLLLSAGALGLNAQTPREIVGEIEDGVTFKPAEGALYTYVASMTGTLLVNVDAPYYYVWSPIQRGSFLFDNPTMEYTDLVLISGANDLEGGGTQYILKNIEEGHTYYFIQTQYPGNVAFTFEMEESSDIEAVISVTPSTSLTFNYIQQAEIHITATDGITSFGDVILSYDNEEILLKAPDFLVEKDGSPGFEFLKVGGGEHATFKKKITELAMEGVKSFTVTVKDLEADGKLVTENETNMEGVVVDNGTVTITYSLDIAPQYLPEESHWPSVFYNFWEPGAANGIAVMKFDQDIAYVDNVNVVMGTLTAGSEGSENEMYASYDLTNKTKAEGNTVTIDFTGVLRRTTQPQVTVLVQNVVGVNGLPVEMTKFSNTTLTLFQYMPYVNSEAPEIDGIESIEALKEEDVIYNLPGVKVNSHDLKPGIYIVNGKKVVLGK